MRRFELTYTVTERFVFKVERADCGAVGFVPKPYELPELCSFLRAKTRVLSPSAC